MTKLTELVERVKNECAGCWYSDHHNLEPFGLSDSSYSLFEPHSIQSKLDWRYWFGPQAYRDLFKYNSERQNGLIVYHHPFSLRKFRKGVKYLAECRTAIGKECSDPEEFLSWFEQKFGNDVSGLRFDIFSGEIVGKRELNQQVMDYLKEDPINAVVFYDALTGYDFSPREIHLYDLFKKPKEVHLQLPQP